MNKNSKVGSEEIDSSLSSDEIDLRLIFKFFLRNKIIVGSFGILFFALSYFYSLSLRREWKGEFQIVLNSETNQNNSISLPNTFFKDSSSNLKTQVGILKSPSVLMPVFEFVAKEKNFNDEFTFSKWEDTLYIGLEKGTSILNISYKDTNRELIIPVLQKISLTFQDYSGKNLRRDQEKTLIYLKDQISLYKVKSSKSLKLAQEFSIDQDLLFNDKLNGNGDFLISNVNITKKRIEASDKIRLYESLLKRIEASNDDYEIIEYIGSTEEVNDEGLPNELVNLDREIIAARQKYQEKDLAITKLLSTRDLLVQLLKKRTIGILNAKKLEAKAQMEAAMRPKGVLLKYKDLMRASQRDESTLISLENQLREFKLEKAKSTDPWELITKPTLFKTPVGPARKKIASYGFIIGIVIGSGIAFYNEKKFQGNDDS